MDFSLPGFLLPYEFSPTMLLATAVSLVIYVRGLYRRGGDGFARPLAWFTGVLLSYAVLQTHVDYMAQHMFFIHRIQHLVLHHVSPFLIMLALPGQTLAAGLPGRIEALLRRGWRSAPVRLIYRFVQQPVIAGVLFVGLIGLWLLPAVHFDAMLSVPLYRLMNWSMLIDGLLFWWLVVNPRPDGAPTNIAYGWRIVLLFLVMWPQIAIGAYLALSEQVIYDIYAVCGRLWPLSPTMDQQLGGLITWIPAAMMSVLGILVVLRYWTRQDARDHGVATPGDTR